MTIQKAIEVLEYARNYDGMDYGAPSIALDMAISALRQQEHFREATKKVGTLTLDELRETPTNADHIRAMSDEELAKIIERELGCPVTGDCEKMYRDCNSCWLDWLQQPAEED